MSGAFPAEYAHALGSVFDLRLRKGNDEKRDFLGQLAFNGNLKLELKPETTQEVLVSREKAHPFKDWMES